MRLIPHPLLRSPPPLHLIVVTPVYDPNRAVHPFFIPNLGNETVLFSHFLYHFFMILEKISIFPNLTFLKVPFSLPTTFWLLPSFHLTHLALRITLFSQIFFDENFDFFRKIAIFRLFLTKMYHSPLLCTHMVPHSHHGIPSAT